MVGSRESPYKRAWSESNVVSHSFVKVHSVETFQRASIISAKARSQTRDRTARTITLDNKVPIVVFLHNLI